MPEKIYTFSDEELARMFKSGEMKVLTTPKPVQTRSDHEKALEKAKELFGSDFEDVQTLEIGGNTPQEIEQAFLDSGMYISRLVLKMLYSSEFTVSLDIKNLEILKLKVSSLGFEHPVQVKPALYLAQKLGLKLCPAEAGFYLRSKDTNQPENTPYYIAMNPIQVQDNDFGLNLCRLFLDQYKGHKWLYSYFDGYLFDPSEKLIFHL